MKNGVMMQYFEWYLPNDGDLWKRITEDAPHLRDIGVTSIWIPPAYKADEQADEGYATYDLYDFGEFEQKGTVRTKYGTKQELIEMIKALHDNQISVYLDVVLNHKAGGDYAETFPVVQVDAGDRFNEITDEFEIESFTGYSFEGRGDKYSPFKWHWYHFSGVDHDSRSGKDGVFRIVGPGKGWSQSVDDENGNYDYLMCNDIDLDNPEVKAELIKWGVWAAKELGLDGVRMDAIKHMDSNFITAFLDGVRKEHGDDFYAVGEYWNPDPTKLNDYIATTEGRIDLFDVTLHYNFYEASKQQAAYDLSKILDGSLALSNPLHAVTFVDNHDSQVGCSLESEVEAWFKPLAYALILLMKDGYPCVFYGDYYGVKGEESPHRKIIDILLDARRRYAFGEQQLVLDDPTLIALLRYGDQEKHPGSGLIMVMSNDVGGEKLIDMGKDFAGTVWHEITNNIHADITLDQDGKASFPVSPRNISVWVRPE